MFYENKRNTYIYRLCNTSQVRASGIMNGEKVRWLKKLKFIKDKIH